VIAADPVALLALDMGTTTLAGRLLTPTGKVLAELKISNPQRHFGADVIRRMERAANGQAKALQSSLVDGLNTLVATLLDTAQLPLTAISAAAACGNPAICALLLHQPVRRLLFPPHRPADLLGRTVDASALRFNLPVPLYLFPLLSGYVGGDLVAFIYGCSDVVDKTFFIDIGTNGEMALYHDGHWLTTSVAAGPAFEGGEISCGMTATNGAITAVDSCADHWQLTVCGGGAPRGVSGSGLVAALGAALEEGLLTRDGRIVTADEVASNLARYLVPTATGQALRLYRDACCDLLLTQDDVRAFQLARGALRAGTLCLLDKAGMAAEDVAAVIMTGAFGFSLSPESLKKVAMLPEPMLKKISFAAAGALAGVERFVRTSAAADVATLAQQLRPLPLSGTPAFERVFLENLDFI